MASRDNDLRDKTRITFYRGIRTIGGNLIEVSYGDSRIVFDCGCEYNPAAPKQPRDLADLISQGYVPYLPAIFDRTIDVPGHHWSADPYAHSAVFVSHAHLDHSKMLNYIDSAIPVYASQNTKRVLEAMNVNDDFDFPPYRKDCNHTRPIAGVEPNGVVRVGSIAVTVMPVDHDAYGASGLRVVTPDAVIAYTGDIRFHGFLEHDTRAFLQANAGADALIMEGTSISFRKPGDPVDRPETTEQQVCDRIEALVRDNPHRQITFNYYLTNIERIQHIIASSPRTVVLSAYAAFVYTSVTGDPVHYYRLNDDRDYSALDSTLEIPFDELLSDQDAYLWQLDDRARAAHLHDLRRNGLYVHTGAAPLGEYDPAYKPFFQGFADQDVEAVTISCSGHATVEKAFEIIDAVRPRLLFPVHGEHPERYRNDYGAMILPEPGLTVEL